MPIMSYSDKMQKILKKCPKNAAELELLNWEYNSDSDYKCVKSSAMATEKEAQELISLLHVCGLRNVTLRCDGVRLLDKQKAYYVDCLKSEVEAILIAQDNISSLSEMALHDNLDFMKRIALLGLNSQLIINKNENNDSLFYQQYKNNNKDQFYQVMTKNNDGSLKRFFADHVDHADLLRDKTLLTAFSSTAWKTNNLLAEAGQTAEIYKRHSKDSKEERPS